MDNYKDAADVASQLTPSAPVLCTRPHAARAAARRFRSLFPGDVFFAVKANPVPWLLDALVEAGIEKFEAASISEVRRIRARFPRAEIAFMHPMKAPEVIAEAYHVHDVRIFALDTEEELDKILAATGQARDLTLCVRHKVSSEHAHISLSKKFGAEGDNAVALLQRARQAAARLGVTFHVGSQTMSPAAFTGAIDVVEETIVRAGVIIDVLDVGGGFPTPYPGMNPPPLEDFIAAIDERFDAMLVAENCALWCEPGRALCADASSIVVRVEGKKGADLYINDGAYGVLFDAGALGWRFPVRRLGDDAPAAVEAFSFFGPTCDDQDYMQGPFMLPADVSVGDYLEIHSLGAYGLVMATSFNGFGKEEYLVVELKDAPLIEGEPSKIASANENIKGVRHGV